MGSQVARVAARAWPQGEKRQRGIVAVPARAPCVAASQPQPLWRVACRCAMRSDESAVQGEATRDVGVASHP